MLAIEVSAMPAGIWYQTYQTQLSLGLKTRTIPGDLFRPLESEPAEVLTYELGKLTQGTKARGTLRDKGVKHLNVSGTLSAQLESLQFGVVGDFPYAKTTSGVDKTFTGVFWWGDPYEYVETWFPEGHLRSGYWLEQPDGQRVTRKVLFESPVSNKMLVTVEVVKGAEYRNTALYTAATVTSTIFRYRRGTTQTGTYAYYIGQQSFQRYLTAADKASAFASITTSGTNLATQWNLQAGAGTTLSLIEAGVIDAVEAQYRSLDLLSYDDPYVDMGELGVECSKQMKVVDTNLLGLMFDVTEWQSLTSLFRTLTRAAPWQLASGAYKRLFGRNRQHWKTAKAALREMHDMLDPASSVYLGTKYGVLPTVSDLGRLGPLFDFVELYMRPQRLHSRKVTSIEFPDAQYGSRTTVLTVDVNHFPDTIWRGWMEFLHVLEAYGIRPELSNAWDRVPLSFAVDWIVQFGDLWDDCQDYLDQKYSFPVSNVVASNKWAKGISITSLVPANLPVTGVVEFSYYVRECMGEIPLPQVSLTAESELGYHSVESAALLFQRIRL